MDVTRIPISVSLCIRCRECFVIWMDSMLGYRPTYQKCATGRNCLPGWMCLEKCVLQYVIRSLACVERIIYKYMCVCVGEFFWVSNNYCVLCFVIAVRNFCKVTYAWMELCFKGMSDLCAVCLKEGLLYVWEQLWWCEIKYFTIRLCCFGGVVFFILVAESYFANT